MAKTITVSRQFPQPAELVFAAMTNFHDAADNITAITSMEVIADGEIGEGTIIRETRKMFGREHTESMTITDWQPPRHYVTECGSCGAHYRTKVSCSPLPDGTEVSLTMTITPQTFMARVMGAVMSPLMKGQIHKAFMQDLDDVAAVLERTDES
jgi:uncharacterized protein YndB with AHSA1/START domain